MKVPTKQKKVLVVDDETPLRKALCDKLVLEGFVALEAINGEIGLERALLERPHINLLDIVMPKMDGITMARELRKDEWGKYVPIIIMTNLSDMEKVQQAMESEIFEYLIKSDIPMEHILGKVKEVLRV